MSRPGAVALITLREGLRSRGPAVLGLIFAGSLALSATLSRGATPEERFRTVLSAAGQGAHLLLILTALLAGALAYPQELKRRNVLNLFSKPVGRGSYLLGKWLGLCGLLLALGTAFGILAAGSLAVLHNPEAARAIRIPLEGTDRVRGTDGRETWGFRRGSGETALRLEVLFASVEPPAGLQAEVSDERGRSVRVPLEFNVHGEAQAELPWGGTGSVLRVTLPPGAEGVRLLSPSGSFPALIAEALLGDWAQACALGAAALAASTFLSGPVALFMAVGLTALAHGHPLLTDLETLLFHRPDQKPVAAVPRVFRTVALATPNISDSGSDALDLCPALDRSEMPPWRALGRTLGVCLAYGVAYLGVGWACLRRAEVGR